MDDLFNGLPDTPDETQNDATDSAENTRRDFQMNETVGNTVKAEETAVVEEGKSVFETAQTEVSQSNSNETAAADNNAPQQAQSDFAEFAEKVQADNAQPNYQNGSQSFTDTGAANKNPYSASQGNPYAGNANPYSSGARNTAYTPYGSAPQSGFYGTRPSGNTYGTAPRGNNYGTAPGSYTNRQTGYYTTSAGNSFTQPGASGTSFTQPGGSFGTSAGNTYPQGGTEPFGAGPDPTNRSFTPGNTASVQPVKTKKKNTGKTVFAILVCACIVISSIAIGFAVTKNKPGNSDLPNTQNEITENSAAEPQVENTPVENNTPDDTVAQKGAMSAEKVYEAVKNINVGVIVYSKTQKVGEGSGIIVGEDKSGSYTYIITCAHVISQANSSIQILFNDDTEVDADIVGYDTKTDVGVLKVKKTGFAAAKFGNSSDLKVGQSVYAIGNPGGSEFFGTFTDGKITALDRPVATSANSYYDLPCIQHNAAINPGNSGGALVNAFGQVIGLNSSKIADTEYEGMGFSVPINTVLDIYKDIVAHGYVTNRPMLGITYYAVSSDYTYSAIAWKNNLPYGSIVIASISPDSDLAGKNIKVGDIIIAVNGQRLESTDVLLEEIENGKVGDSLKLTVCRLTSSGAVESKNDINVKLVEDKGTNTVESQQEPATDDFSSFFPFGY